VWERESAAEQRRSSKERNDGSRYLEPHARCHQIEVEKWLREQVEREEMIESYWGVGFEGLREEEEDDGGKVVSEARRESDGARVRVTSKYVVGCDGGGSWVRKSVGLESKRNYL
jgi:2-polyprenyl-6-methoxyphenol hydroxylase-like FAD-dependent oxidoreductase